MRGGTFGEILRCVPLTLTLSPGGEGIFPVGEARHTAQQPQPSAPQKDCTSAEGTSVA